MMAALHALIASVALLLGIVVFAAWLTWVERRLLGFLQDRLGPNRVGWQGSLQIVADMIKIFFKQDWTPAFSDRSIFIAAPVIVMATVLLGFAVIPFTPAFGIAPDFNIGLLFFLGMTSLSVYGVVLAGWASNSKFSLLGGMRAAAQMISYEVFMGLAVIGVVMLTGSFQPRRHRARAAAFMVCGAAIRGLRSVPYRRHRRSAPPALRPAGRRERAWRRFPHRIFQHQIRHVLLWREWFEAAGRSDVTGAKAHYFDTMGLSLDAAANGLGVGMGVDLLCQDDLAAGRLIAPLPVRLEGRRAIYFTCRKPDATKVAIRKFKSWLMAEMGRYAPTVGRS